MTFVDTHVHFWDRSKLEYDWLAGLPPIAAAHTPETLATEAGDAVPAQIVFVQAGSNGSQGGAEAQWVSALAAREPRIAGIVAFAPMDAGPSTVAALEQLTALPLVRGVRHNVQDEADARHCLRPAFAAGVRELGARGLSFDHCCKHHQLSAFTELVRATPGTSFILDHAGKPDIRGGLLDPWRENIAALARLPNVVCKLSGLVTEADCAAWQPGHLRPYVDHLRQTFGPARLLFGSDWPVVKLASPYRRWLETAQYLLASLSDEERDAVFHGNARRVYRLSPPSPHPV